MQVEIFTGKIKALGIDTLIGVPDSTLKQFCDYINTDGKDEFEHYVPANEGAATGMAVGTFLATGKPACVYMQNSGIGNIVNPVTSIANEEVYDIPILFLVGWRGEPGKKDEPQHKFMGKVTTSMFDVMNIEHACIGKETTDDELDTILQKAKMALCSNRQFAIIIKKDTFEARGFGDYNNSYPMNREAAIRMVLEVLERDDVVVSTTGKISREVYEQCDDLYGSHEQAFLTVGGMGHASMIALAYAMKRPQKRVYCLDGDGAVLMHMGALPLIAKQAPQNLVHICINNEAHESVGGMPTGAAGMTYADIAKASGYKNVYQVQDEEALKSCMEMVKNNKELTFVEVLVAIGSRDDLGRPKESAVENKKNFMEYHGV